MWRIYGGAVLVIAGIVAFIEARTHKPCPVPGSSACPAAGHLELIAYRDLLKGGAMLVILGTLLIAVWLIRYWTD
jgi:hypothetical protein